MSRWPKDNQTALIKFYGDPGAGEVGDQLVKITPPFKMYYEGKLLKTLSFHKKAAPALLSALTKVWDYYDHDQATIDKLGISKTAGTYNPRKIRGSATKWSNHAYGAAIDINAEQNGFNVAGNIPPVMIAAFKSEGARWGGDYKSRKDPMHFEFCDGGEPQRSFEEWLKVLGVKPKAVAADASRAGVGFPARATPGAGDVPDHVKEDFAEPDDEEEEDAAPHGKEGVDIEVIQRRLNDFGYHEVGEIDGKWGGKTAGAVAAFKNDRRLPGKPVIDDALKAEITKAGKEKWVRTVAPARSFASEAAVAEKVPELVPVKQNRVAALWGSITAAFAVVANAVSSYFKDALAYVNDIKDYLAGVPGWLWCLGVLGLCVAFYINSKKGTDGIAQAFRSGERN